MALITFENGIDIRSREAEKPTVAKIRIKGAEYRYCVIGTDYGHIHTTGGDVRTWGSYSGSYRAVKNYVAL